MKIAVLIKLDKKTNKKINNLKFFFKREQKKCLYINDFPHITLLSARIKLNLNQLRQTSFNIKYKPIKVNILKPQVFHDDQLTGGKTFIFNVKKNKKLLDLQLSVSNFFKKYLSKIKTNNTFLSKSKEYKSLKTYGFPYVGKHWIPHVTICSVLDKNINEKVYKKFATSKINSVFFIDNCFLCIVKKNSLKVVKKINFIN